MMEWGNGGSAAGGDGGSSVQPPMTLGAGRNLLVTLLALVGEAYGQQEPQRREQQHGRQSDGGETGKRIRGVCGARKTP